MRLAFHPAKQRQASCCSGCICAETPAGHMHKNGDVVRRWEYISVLLILDWSRTPRTLAHSALRRPHRSTPPTLRALLRSDTDREPVECHDGTPPARWTALRHPEASEAPGLAHTFPCLFSRASHVAPACTSCCRRRERYDTQPDEA